MSSIIETILKEKSINDKLENYIFVSTDNCNDIPLGCHIKFIDRNENLKTGGFLIKYVKNKDRTKCYFILKSNLIYKLYVYYFWIFYKVVNHESKISKQIKKYNNIILKIDTSLPKQENIIDASLPKQEKLIDASVPKQENIIDASLLKQENNEDSIIIRINDKKIRKKNSKRDAFLKLLDSLDNL